MFKFLGFPIKFVQTAAVSAKPQITGMILVNRQDCRIVETLGIVKIPCISNKLVVLAIVFVDTAGAGSDPKSLTLAVGILINSPDFIIAQAIWVCRVVAILRKSFRKAVKFTKSGIGANPQLPKLVFVNRIYRISGDAVFCVGIKFVVCKKVVSFGIRI